MPKRDTRAKPSVCQLTDLTSDPRNANRGTPRGQEALDRSLRQYGPARSVVIDRHGRIISGNKTVARARALGLPLRVVKSDGTTLIGVQRDDLDLLTDPRAKELAIADNRVGELDLCWDAATLQQFQAEGLNLSPFWTDPEFAALVGGNKGLADENAVVEPGPTDIKPGDLFNLGPHRILCGDATSPGDVARALGGANPVLMATDPPYGVSYDPAWRHRAHPNQRTATGRVINDDRADWTPAWNMFPGTIAYVWHAALHGPVVATSLENAGFRLRGQMIWVKQHFALSRGDYHWGHEPAWYAIRGPKGQWRGDRRQTTVWEVPNLNPMGGTRAHENTITGHATQKPVRLFEIPILNHTSVGDSVYDPFLGSGTALVAAEKLGRVCLGIEIDPKYVQAALTRWERFTGATAVRHSANPRPARRTR